MCKFIIKVAMLSAVSLLELLLSSYSLIKFRASFVLSEKLTYTFRSKISLHVEAERKGISTVINSKNKRWDGVLKYSQIKGKIYMGSRKYTTFLVTHVLVICIVNGV